MLNCNCLRYTGSRYGYAAINSLPEKQAKRIYAYYFMDMDEPAIAKAEGVSQQAVHSSIQRGLRRIESFLKEFY